MQTIVFLTLFLGLVEGRQVVELAAADEVARVEVLLDGELEAVITGGPPWRAPVDLSGDLAPRLLEAVARDAAGEELGRAEQWLNLPRGRAEVTLLVDRSGPRAVARIGWRSVEHPRPEAVVVHFDGEPVPVGGPLAAPLEVPLPDHAPDAMHVVSAEAVFPGGDSARADVAFGGPYGDQVSSELTGVAVEVEGERRLRKVGDAGPWLRVGGEVLRPVALDAGEVDLYAVVDAAARPQLEVLGIQMARMLRSRGARLPTGPRSDRLRAGPVPPPTLQTGMHPGDRLYLVRPQTEDAAPGVQLFGLSEALDDSRGGSAWQLSYVSLPHDPDRPQRLADAAAAAGMMATSTSRPRCVLLLLGPGSVDDSVLDPGEVWRYFERLRVPLEVWYLDTGEGAPPADLREGESREAWRRRQLEEARRRWGAVQVVEGSHQWLRFHARLRDDLARQRILWIEGRHLPQAVELAGAPDWLRLAGGSAPP